MVADAHMPSLANTPTDDVLSVVVPREEQTKVEQKHRLIAALVLYGVSQREISEKLGIPQKSVGVLCRTPQVRDAMRQMETQVEEMLRHYALEGKAGLGVAQDTVRAIMEDPEASDADRLKAALAWMDRHGMPKRQKSEVEVRHTLSGEDIDRINQRALEAQNEGRRVTVQVKSPTDSVEVRKADRAEEQEMF